MSNPETILSQGGVGILATDTLYGIVGQALCPKTVERIYRLKQRSLEKPFIILIARPGDVTLFGVELNSDIESILEQHWPGPVSVILPSRDPAFTYLHRGTNSLAFRLPAKASLQRLLKATGPLVAPSANPEGQPPAQSLAQARAYFGDGASFYRSGRTSDRPSRLLRWRDGQLEVLRD